MLTCFYEISAGHTLLCYLGIKRVSKCPGFRNILVFRIYCHSEYAAKTIFCEIKVSLQLECAGITKYSPVVCSLSLLAEHH